MNDSLHSASDPPRWKDRADQTDAVERAVGHAFRCARAVPLRPAPPLARVAARIRFSRPSRGLAWIAATAGFVLTLATAALAAHFDLLPTWLTSITRPSTVAPTREPARPQRTKIRAGEGASPTQAPALSPCEDVPAIEQPSTSPDTNSAATTATTPAGRTASTWLARLDLAKLSRDERPHRAIQSPGATAPSVAQVAYAAPSAAPSGSAASVWPGPVDESRPSALAFPPVATGAAIPAPTNPLLAPPQAAKQSAGQHLTEAIRLLRVEHSPAAVLRYLDARDGELAKGGFEHEALILRVEALLALGRRGEVLRLLDGASLTDVAASRTLLVTRGQLRAAANRCGEGVGDFDLVLARSRQVDRQALIGRALCRKQLGDSAGMRTDVQRLRSEFPTEALPAGLQ
jgi:hypothetical protein